MQRKFALQSAMEYLMTYGWVILIIAVVLGALYQLGIFGTSQNALPPSCIASVGFYCTNPIMNTTGYLGVTLGQIGISTMTITSLACTNNLTAPSFNQNVLTVIPSGSRATIAFSCQTSANSIGTSFKGYLWITYNTPTQSGLINRIALVNGKIQTTANVILAQQAGGQVGATTITSSSSTTTSTSTSTSSTSTSTSTSTTSTTTTSILYPSIPSFSCYGSFYPCTYNIQNNPSNTLADDMVAGNITTSDLWLVQDEGGTWVWDFGASHTGTFTVKWYASSVKNPSYCENVVITISASNDGLTYTPFVSYTQTASTNYGSSGAPIVSSITGTYRYVKFDQYSSTGCITSPAIGYVDVVEMS